MADNRLSKVSREELYQLVWSKPLSKLAAELGVSGAAIGDRCRRLGVPRPTQGYWAKLAVGHSIRVPPLPPSPEEQFQSAAEKPPSDVLKLPPKGRPLHSLAVELQRRISEVDLSYGGVVRLREPALPETVCSKLSAERIARSFHVILQGTEPIGLPFDKSRGKYDGGYFRRGTDRLYLSIEEVFGHERQGWPRGSYVYGREPELVSSGRLKFTINPARYAIQNAKSWTEGDELPLERLLSKLVFAIRRHFVDTQRRRAEAAKKQAKWHEEWMRKQKEAAEQAAIRRRQEAETLHVERVLAVERGRRQNLFRAAEGWRRSLELREFVAACEAKWRAASGELTGEQKAWLQWAEAIAREVCPFGGGYPDPEYDGQFDKSAVPFGGPYPKLRSLDADTAKGVSTG